VLVDEFDTAVAFLFSGARSQLIVSETPQVKIVPRSRLREREGPGAKRRGGWGCGYV